jgi:hypothetical protein
MNLHLLGTCLYPTDEDHRVSERIASLKGRRGILILYGLIRGVIALLFFCRIMLSILGKRSMVIKDR